MLYPFLFLLGLYILLFGLHRYPVIAQGNLLHLVKGFFKGNVSAPGRVAVPKQVLFGVQYS